MLSPEQTLFSVKFAGSEKRTFPVASLPSGEQARQLLALDIQLFAFFYFVLWPR